jgi:hypothetical protein
MTPRRAPRRSTRLLRLALLLGLASGGAPLLAGCSYIENEFLFLDRVRPPAAEPTPGAPPSALAARA